MFGKSAMTFDWAQTLADIERDREIDPCESADCADEVARLRASRWSGPHTGIRTACGVIEELHRAWGVVSPRGADDTAVPMLYADRHYRDSDGLAVGCWDRVVAMGDDVIGVAPHRVSDESFSVEVRF